MEDRRFYSRLKIQSTILLYIGEENTEISGVITDISEESIGIAIDESAARETDLKNDSRFKFVFADKYIVGKKENSEVISANAIVKRISFSNGKCRLGCIIHDEKYEKYATGRKFVDYFNNIEE